MKDRKTVTDFIKYQFTYGYTCKYSKPNAWHYGKQELKELLDFIYEEGERLEDGDVDFRDQIRGRYDML